MPRLSDLWFRVRALFGGSRMDRDFVEEMEFHLEMETRELLRRGASPREARCRAVLALGGVDRYREEARDARGVRPLEDLGRDLRLGLRSLGRAPLFTGVILFVLALGIGSATAIFSVVDGVLFRPLPYPEGERIVRVFNADDRDERGTFAGADYLDIEVGSRSVEQLAGYNARSSTLVGEGGPEHLRGASVTPGFFRVFGVDAALGRTLSPGIEGPGHPATVVLGHGLWQTVFGADPTVVGKTIELDDRPFQVVGVMPPAFDYPGVGLWTSARDARSRMVSR